jgi:DNA repair protein RadD
MGLALMTPELRPYQAGGIEAARQHVREGRQRVILCLPTGGGKSVVMASIIQSARRNFDVLVLVIAHRIELIDQAVNHLERWGVTEVGVIMAQDARTAPLMPVQVASIQTLARRDLPAADIVFIDEAHRALGATYQRVIAGYPEASIFGLTATPIRSDGKPMGDVFEAIEPIASYSQLIADGFIVEPRCFGAPREPDLSKVKTIAGDFDLGGLEFAMSQAEILGDTVAEWQRRSEGRRTVVFACTVAHSIAIACKFEVAGARVAHVDASTPEDERREIGARLRSGDLQVVTNVGIYTEGWDEPCVKCIILARPTKSLGLYMQMAGRALRPWDGVTPILIDQGGNVDRFGFPTDDREWSLTSEQKPRQRKPSKCIKCGAFLRHYPCTECGFAPEISPREIVERPAVELSERKARVPPADPKRALFDASLREAQRRGFKPGYPSAKVKEKFGEWPPWAWGQEVKQLYETDEDWQQRVIEHAAEKARWTRKAEPGPTYDTEDERKMDDGIPF